MKTLRIDRSLRLVTLATMVVFCVAICLLGTQQRAEGWSAGPNPINGEGIPAGGAHRMMTEDAIRWLSDNGWLYFSETSEQLIKDGASVPDAIHFAVGSKVLAVNELEYLLGREDLIDLGVCKHILCEVLMEDFDKLQNHSSCQYCFWLNKARQEATEYPVDLERAKIHAGYAMHFAQDHLNPAHLGDGWDDWEWGGGTDLYWQLSTWWEITDYNYVKKAKEDFEPFGMCLVTRIS